METGKLKKFAQFARKALREQVAARLDLVLAKSSLARRESEDAVKELEAQIKHRGRDEVVERVAYTWFNRFCALRYMDVNRITRIGVVSPTEGFSQPEILIEAKQGNIDDDLKVDRKLVMELLDGTRPSSDPQQEAYRLLLVAVCNSYHDVMPFMFEKIADYTELLLPHDLLSGNAVLSYTREALIPANCSPEFTDQSVEVIGWLYQFYISEKKDEVFDALKKGKKITPENIPAATQLFTPHWIVRYLVENSLGRLWMLNFPNSKLVDRMEYYIRPEQPETDFLRISSPEEIKICDPACGSGHMLTYAFDLLYAIYEEQGYQATEIPRLILTHNLFGVEIDQRAGALAAFALTMKAREKDRRFFTRGRSNSGDSTATRSSAPGTQPNICVLENIHIDPDDLSAYMDKVGRDLFSGGLQGVVNQWEEADNFGSLIRPLVTDVSEVLQLLRERQMGEDLFLAGVHQKVLKALRQADCLSPKYHVVVANPPYMGARGLNSSLRSHSKKHFDVGRFDLFGMFILRNRELCKKGGRYGMITMQSWMFLSSYDEMRCLLLDECHLSCMAHLGPHAFDSIGGEVVSTAAFVIENQSRPSRSGHFIRATHGNSESEKMQILTDAIAGKDTSEVFYASDEDLKSIPSFPIAYWVSQVVREVFGKYDPIGKLAAPRKGNSTTDNARFLRFWPEVSKIRMGVGLTSADATENGVKWIPYNKGGGYRKWYGLNEFLINWQNNGAEIKAIPHAVIANEQYFWEPGLTWSTVSAGRFSIRRFGHGFIFDNGGCSVFGDNATLVQLLALMNSNVFATLYSQINPTLNYQSGDVSRVPAKLNSSAVPELVEEAVDISKADWDRFETSWDFIASPLITSDATAQLSSRYGDLRSEWEQDLARLKQLEQEINSEFITSYGLSDEIDVTVEYENLSLEVNPAYRYASEKSKSELEALLLADTMREFISYAVGCMLGRYSLDKPGLILANQGETADDYRKQIPEPIFAPDEDNVIPLLDGDWFEDDITERFKEFLKVTFGTEHYDENLTFLENALYTDNLNAKKRKTIRDYFLKDFYNHHIKLYKKRPIYWLFSSPKGTFNALIYMHRYRPDTVSVVLGYLRDFNAKLKAKVESLQRTADSANASATEKTKALKEIVTLKKDIRELDDYERDILYPLATERLEIDLDDGVKVNYPKFGKALKKNAGMDAGDDD
jgi:hypothetical protein